METSFSLLVTVFFLVSSPSVTAYYAAYRRHAGERRSISSDGNGNRGRCMSKFKVAASTIDVSVPTASSSTEETWSFESWKSGYATSKKEDVLVLQPSSTSADLPVDLEGTFFRNGYGNFEVNPKYGPRFLHPFDCDGMISAVTLKDGQAVYRNSMVRTNGFKYESKTGRMAGRGFFSNHKPLGSFFGNFLNLKLKNVANTNAIYWGNRLLALWEGGLPYRIEPDSLRTVGEYTFKGLLKKGDSFTAHPRIDPIARRLIGFGVKTSGSESSVNVYEFNEDMQLTTSRTFTLTGLPFFHDFIVTKNYYVFNAPPLEFQPLPFILGQKGGADCISFKEGRPSTIFLVPRDTSEPVQTVEVDAHFNFHFANGFEDSQGRVCFDVVWSDRMVLNKVKEGKEDLPVWETVDYANDVPFSQLQRYTFTRVPSPSADNSSNNNNNGKGSPVPQWTYEKRKLSNTMMDFTSVNPRVSCQPHRFIFAQYSRDPVRASPGQGLIKVDFETGTETKWIGSADEFLGEPIFAPKKNAPTDAAEDDGYVLSYLSDWKAGKSEFVVFDAKDIAKGPIYRAQLSTVLPQGLHGSYVPGLTFEPEDIIQRWKACNAIDTKRWNEVNSGFSGLGIVQGF